VGAAPCHHSYAVEPEMLPLPLTVASLHPKASSPPHPTPSRSS
jgi:hypothetical protein